MTETLTMRAHALLSDVPRQVLARAVTDVELAFRVQTRAWVALCDAATAVRRVTPPETIDRSGERGAVAELALIGRLSEQSARRIWEEAIMLARRPATRGAALTGRVTVGQAKVLIEDLHTVDPVIADRIEAELLAAAGEGVVRHTPAQLRVWVQRRVLAADPEHARRRRRLVVRDETGVRYRPIGDGLAELVLTGPADRALGVMRTLDRLTPSALAWSDPTGPPPIRGPGDSCCSTPPPAPSCWLPSAWASALSRSSCTSNSPSKLGPTTRSPDPRDTLHRSASGSRRQQSTPSPPPTPC